VSQGFVGRWHRLKSEHRRRREAPVLSSPGDDRPGAAASPPAAEEAEAAAGSSPFVDLPSAAASASPEAVARADAGGVGSAAAPEAADPVADLPPVATLTKDSDYAPFLKAGVPPALKNAALRQLWRSDPVLAAPELLDLHNLDYTLPKTPEVVRTAYAIGKGYLDAAEPPDAATADRATAEPERDAGEEVADSVREDEEGGSDAPPRDGDPAA